MSIIFNMQQWADFQITCEKLYKWFNQEYAMSHIYHWHFQRATDNDIYHLLSSDGVEKWFVNYLAGASKSYVYTHPDMN